MNAGGREDCVVMAGQMGAIDGSPLGIVFLSNDKTAHGPPSSPAISLTHCLPSHGFRTELEHFLQRLLSEGLALLRVLAAPKAELKLINERIASAKQALPRLEFREGLG